MFKVQSIVLAAALISYAAAVTPWTGDGCPKAYAEGGDYDAGEVVSVAMGSYTMVYLCAEEPTNLFCGQTGFAPGVDQYWEHAWTPLGSCTGTIAPTDSPIYDILPDEGGCPSVYDSGIRYDKGDKVSKDGLVYQCKVLPFGLHCSQAGYEPNTNLATPDAW